MVIVAPWSVVIFERTGRTVPALRTAYLLALSRIELALSAAVAVIAAAVAVPLLATQVPYLGPLLLVALPAATATLVIALHDRATAARDTSTPTGSRPVRLPLLEKGPR